MEAGSGELFLINEAIKNNVSIKDIATWLEAHMTVVN